MTAQRELRVRRFTRHDWTGFQIIQERRWWGWKTIGREEIPSFVSISLVCFGDTGGWRSKFASYGSFGADGLIVSTGNGDGCEGTALTKLAH